MLSIGCGCLAQFYYEFPNDKLQLLYCIIAYAILTATGHAFEYFGMRGCAAILSLDTSNNNKTSKSSNQDSNKLKKNTFFRTSVLYFVFVCVCVCFFFHIILTLIILAQKQEFFCFVCFFLCVCVMF